MKRKIARKTPAKKQWSKKKLWSSWTFSIISISLTVLAIVGILSIKQTEQVLGVATSSAERNGVCYKARTCLCASEKFCPPFLCRTKNVCTPPKNITITITPHPTVKPCKPLPYCLTHKPYCKIAQPVEGWCHITPTPTITTQ